MVIIQFINIFLLHSNSLFQYYSYSNAQIKFKNRFLFMKFIFLLNKTPLNIAVENENINIVALLLGCKNVDVNLPNILMFFFF